MKTIKLIILALAAFVLSSNVWSAQIAYWTKQKITKDVAITATIGTGSMTSTIAFGSEGKLTYNGNAASSTEIVFSGLSMSSYSNVQLKFVARGSAEGTFGVYYSTDNGDSYTQLTTTSELTGEEVLYTVTGIPSTSTNVKLVYNASTGSLFFGCPRFQEQENGSYVFEKLDASNTEGWSGSDWDGKYILRGAGSNNALNGGAPGEKSYYTISEVDNTITLTELDPAFQITYVQNSGYTICGVGLSAYINETSSSGNLAVSFSPSYNATVAATQIKGSSYYLRYNASAFKYYNSSAQGYDIQLYKLQEATKTDVIINKTTGAIGVGGNIDVSTLFSLDASTPSTGTKSYSITEGGSFGSLGVDGKTLTGTSAGTVTVKMQITADQNYKAGQATTTVTISNTHTVTWKVDGETYTAGSPTTNVAHGGKVATLPTAPATPASCEGAVFMGWTDHEVTSGSVPSPLFKTAADAPVVNADVTYHAVFADED